MYFKDTKTFFLMLIKTESDHEKKDTWYNLTRSIQNIQLPFILKHKEANFLTQFFSIITAKIWFF